MSKSSVNFRMMDSVVIRCSAPNGLGGGIYCTCKDTLIESVCFHSCHSSNYDAFNLISSDTSSKAMRVVNLTSVVQCPCKQKNSKFLYVCYGYDFFADFNLSACYSTTAGSFFVCGFLIFEARRWNLANCIGDEIAQFHKHNSATARIANWNIFNNSQLSSSSYFFMSESAQMPLNCKDSAFIRNNYTTLCTKPSLYSFEQTSFYGNVFSSGSYATSLAFNFKATALCYQNGLTQFFSKETNILHQVFFMTALVWFME